MNTGSKKMKACEFGGNSLTEKYRKTEGLVQLSGPTTSSATVSFP